MNVRQEPAQPLSGDATPLSAIELDNIEPASSFATSTDGLFYDTTANGRLSPSGANQISLADVETVDVNFRNLSVTVDTSPSVLELSTYGDLFSQMGKKNAPQYGRTKTLIHSVNASLQAGTLTAIIGGSGSGKTTLLNTIAERVTSSRLTQTGTATFNAQEDVHSVRSAYVMQQDILVPTLTVRETLQYSADLRLPASTTDAERMRVVEEVILELGLKECAETRVGNSQHRGCSGGEKRRVSIGVQMLANPSVLFLDEPTTGLDATSAFQLVRTLKSLATAGRTVITTIHQPRSEIWGLFDNLIILTKGSPVYSGPIKDCLPWFADLGFELPPFVNPAEYVIDLSAIDNRTPEREEASTTRVETLKAAWTEESEKRHPPRSCGKSSVAAPRKPKHRNVEQHAGYVRQVRVLTDRAFKITYRDPMGIAASVLEAVLMGLCTGYIFYNLGRDQAGIRSREGALYTAAGLQGYLFLILEVYRLTIDIPLFDRENSEGCSDPLAFLISRRLARMFTEDLPVPFLYSVIFYFMAGFDRDADKFLTFFAIVLINHYIAVTCAMVCVASIRNFPAASLMANMIYTLQSMACGYFIQSNTIPVYVRWLKWLTYNFYVFGALCSNEFHGSFYDCPYGDATNPACVSYTGEYILNSLGFPPDWLWRPIIICVSFVVFFCIVAWIELAFFKVETTIARARASDTDLSAGKEKLSARSISEVRTIDVGLDKFSLALEKRWAAGKKLPIKSIVLRPLSATFKAGVLNIIMGPSGSGKTSLLNAVALRLRNSATTRYRPSGKLTFNGAVPSDAVIRSVCSYVCQDDEALLPSLTVRETLRFAAGLRLPPWMSKEEKHRRAEEVLLKMGLKDCADNFVGNDLVKGISGGEKRRVTIAVQILTDPRILLLDEPTSGLDAFTASSIMEVLQGLAQEGRTLILTIHQARSNLLKHFGNVLLLARGGSPVYAGAAKDMLPYFGQQGFECPTQANPADFALDLITIDLQQAQREVESRVRVKALIDGWQDHIEACGSDNIAPARLSDIKEAEEEAFGYIDENEEAANAGPGSSATKSSVKQRSSRIPGLYRIFNKAHLATPAELGALVRKRASFITALPILMHRAIINFRRQPPLLMARLMQVIGLALILALFFSPLHHDYFSIQNRVGYVQEVGAFYFVGMLQNMAVYPAERDVFYREDDDGVYSVEAFLVTYTLLEIPFEIISALIWGILADFAIGLPHTVELYFVNVLVCFGIVSCGESLGIMFNTVFGHTGFAVNLVSVFLSVANIMGGIMSINMPGLFQAFNYLSPIRYAVRSLAPFTLKGVEFTCDVSQRLPDGQCIISTGEQVLQLYKLDVNGVVNIGALVGCIVVYRLAAWALLRIVRTRWEDKGRRRNGKA